jgi:hypothetical protein
VYVAGASVTLSSDTVQSNTATSFQSSSTPVGNGYGGGLYVAAAATVYLDAFTLANCTGNSPNNIDGSYVLLRCSPGQGGSPGPPSSLQSAASLHPVLPDVGSSRSIHRDCVMGDNGTDGQTAEPASDWLFLHDQGIGLLDLAVALQGGAGFGDIG